MFDLLIENATIVDGSGAPAPSGGVGVRSGRIVAVGDVHGEAATTVDATGRILAPGFIDPHTHFDAQLFWDPSAGPSSWHGVTSVISGNCGFTLAPIKAADAPYTREMMAKVEGMPLEALENGVPWNWASFGEYLDRLAGRIAVNAGFMVGHCALRRYVLGPGFRRTSTDDELAQISELLHQAIREGGLGLSTTRSSGHVDGDGEHAPSWWASEDEVLELARISGQYDGTSLEMITDGCVGSFTDAEIELLARMSAESGRTVNWNVLRANAATEPKIGHQLAPSRRARELGGRVIALTMPTLVDMNMSFLTYCGLWRLPGWPEVLDLDVDDKIRALKDPSIREKMLAGAAGSPLAYLANFSQYLIGDVYSDVNAAYRHRKVGDIAAERGVDPFTALVDIVASDRLRTVLWPLPDDDSDADWEARRRLWQDSDVMLGGSDAGAHLDRMLGASYPTRFLADSIRGRRLVPMEQAVQMITDTPAQLFGLVGRGRIVPGHVADLVIFNPETIDSGPAQARFDLPGGAKRLVADSVGIDQVYVAGTLTVADGKPTGATPGAVLRSGRDTSTHDVPRKGSDDDRG